MFFSKVRKKNIILNYINKNLDKALFFKNRYHWELMPGHKLILSKKDNKNFVFMTKNGYSKLSFYYTDHLLRYFENQLTIKEIKQLLGV